MNRCFEYGMVVDLFEAVHGLKVENKAELNWEGLR